jgi:ribosome-associated toxin RatA of RatAB toxin-antitoxin module
MPAPALAVLPPLSPWSEDEEVAAPICTEVSATLPVGARTAFEAFSDVAQTPRWLSVVQSARVCRTDAEGRPLMVAFLARLERATIGYSLGYAWDATDLSVEWHTPVGGSVHICGEARFVPLSARACLFHYKLTLELPFESEWVNASFTGNAAAAVASEFREHLRRAAG